MPDQSDDAKRADLVRRVELMRQVEAKRSAEAPADPNQPGVQAIGSNGTPGTNPEPDWVDKLKNYYDKTHEEMIAQQEKNNQANFGSNMNPIQNLIKKALPYVAPVSKVLSYPLQWGDRAEDLGVPGLQNGPHIPWTNNKKVTLKQMANLAGNTVGAELLARGVGVAGEGIYDSAFKKIDEKMLEKGKTPFSTVMKENGMPAGSMKKIDKVADELRTTKTAERAADYQTAADKGVTVDPDYPSPEAEAVIARMRRDPNLREQADALEEHLNNYRKEGKVPLDQMSEWKSNLANSLPKSAYDPKGKVGPWGEQYKKALASDYRNAIVEGGDVAEAGMGQRIDKTNDELGTLIESQKPAAKQISRENTTNNISSIDAPLLYLKLKAGLLKKAADMAKLTSVRTHAGKGMMSVAPSLGPALQTNALANTMNPWSQNGEN